MNLFEPKNENPIKGEIFSPERLEEYAGYLATELKVSADPKVIQLLLPRTQENSKTLMSSYRLLTEAIAKKESLPPSAEWFTDNFHVVEEQLREIQEDLPPSFYKELPKIELGDLAGYPRIYALSLALVAHTDSRLEPETIKRFIDAFQKITPLGIGELWALAITFRLVLVENLRRVVITVVDNQTQTAQANRYVDHLIETVRDGTEFQKQIALLPSMCSVNGDHNDAFIAQIVKRLRDKEPEFWPALDMLEKHLKSFQSSSDPHSENTTENTSEQIVNHFHQSEASNQITVANIITSMRLLSSINWQDFFESVSLVDRILRADPTYTLMDFQTRDRYRHVIEKLSKRGHQPEIEVAQAASDLASRSRESDKTDSRDSHVGYYLLGTGKNFMEAGIKRSFATKILDFLRFHPALVYFGLIGIFFSATEYGALDYAHSRGASFAFLIAIALLIAIPCSELALNLTNLALTHAIRPENLCKLDYSKAIPDQGRTIVIIPCMITSAQTIHELLEKIEIHYLGNTHQNLFFALVTDYADASQENRPEDAQLLALTQSGIQSLNKKYPDIRVDRFFLFHRRRLWNESEAAWMGWERKRGKIQEFNRLLRGNKDTSFLVNTAPPELLPTIRYVITLDADTQLPRGSASRLIGTIMHPLNRARVDKVKKIIDGYAILQPRIGISLESSARSFFAKIFSGFTGIDPYTTAVSDVYQDYFHEGNYTGKGLYDVDAFESALENRVPENTILSHDLFEGLHSRTALVTDIELLDDFPSSYQSFFSRQHRWTRGDWQIAPWLFSKVKNAQSQWVANDLSWVKRWRIFDNLRRSLVAPFAFLWFILAWAVFPGSLVFWLSYILVIMIVPCLAQLFIGGIARYLRKSRGPRRGLFSTARASVNILQILLYIIFLAHQAVSQLDAIFRVAYRSWISKLTFCNGRHRLIATGRREIYGEPPGRRSLCWS